MSRISRKKKKVADHDVKLLLNETIRHLGKVGDVVKVKPGYARNYLVPRGLAIAPTPKNLERIESKRKEYEKFEASRREDQTALLAKLEGHEVKLTRRANERGGLYGSVGASDIAHALSEAGMAEHGNAVITADEINLHGKIDHIGNAEADVRFADDLVRELVVVVEPDEESRETIEEYQAEQAERDAAFAAQEAAEKERALAAAEEEGS
jgi:large subunit ribosomal protein L9